MAFAARLQALIRAIAAAVDAGAQDATSLVTELAAVLGENPEAYRESIELAFRIFVNSRIVANKNGVPALARVLLAITIDLASKPGMERMKHLPILLIEDCFDALPISECEAVWAVFEERINDSRPDGRIMYHQSIQVPLIRLATALTKRVSRTQQTVFLGRILIAVAVLFPLTEKSGVNLAGHFDVSNVTSYDGAEEDARLLAEVSKDPTQGGLPATPGAKPAAGAAGKDKPAAAASSAVPINAPNSDSATSIVLPTLPLHEGAASHLREAAAAVESGSASESPAFYRAFWRLQAYAVHPSRATASWDAWALFVGTLRLVLRAFAKQEAAEGLLGAPTAAAGVTGPGPQGAAASGAMGVTNGGDQPLLLLHTPGAPTAAGTAGASSGSSDDWGSDDAMRGASASGHARTTRATGSGVGASTTSGSADADADSGASGGTILKYLTSHRLLPLELRDAGLRRHVLLQCLILASYLSSQKRDYDAWVAACAEAGFVEKRVPKDVKRPKERFPTPVAGAPYVPIIEDMGAFTAQIYRQLGRMGGPRDGPAFVRSLRSLLEREAFWRSWKAGGAGRFERDARDLAELKRQREEDAGEDAADAALRAEANPFAASAAGSRKRLRGNMGALASSSGGAKKRPLAWASSGLETDLHALLADASRRPRPAMATLLQPMRDALDPDSGIEKEYWASSDRVFVWRAYRVIASERLGAMELPGNLPGKYHMAEAKAKSLHLLEAGGATDAFLDVCCDVLRVERQETPAARPRPASKVSIGSVGKGGAAGGEGSASPTVAGTASAAPASGPGEAKAGDEASPAVKAEGGDGTSGGDSGATSPTVAAATTAAVASAGAVVPLVVSISPAGNAAPSAASDSHSTEAAVGASPKAGAAIDPGAAAPAAAALVSGVEEGDSSAATIPDPAAAAAGGMQVEEKPSSLSAN